MMILASDTFGSAVEQLPYDCKVLFTLRVAVVRRRQPPAQFRFPEVVRRYWMLELLENWRYCLEASSPEMM